MKRSNAFLKTLALTLAFMLVFSCVGMSAFAEERKPDPDGNVIINAETGDFAVNGNVEGYVEVFEYEGETTLTVDGAVDEGVSVNAVSDTSVTVKTGDVSDDPSTYRPGVYVFTEGEKANVDITVKDIEAERDGIIIENNGGTVEVKSEAVEAGTGGVSVWDQSGGQTTVDVNGGITVKPHERDAMGVAVQSTGGTTKVNVTGDVDVSGKEDHYAGIMTGAESGTAEVTVTGNVTVDAKGSIGLAANPTGDGAYDAVTVNGTVTVNGDDSLGIATTVDDGGTSEVNVGKKLIAKGENSRAVYTYNFGGEISVTVGEGITSDGDGLSLGDKFEWERDHAGVKPTEDVVHKDGDHDVGEIYDQDDNYLGRGYERDLGDSILYYVLDENGKVIPDSAGIDHKVGEIHHEPGTTEITVTGDVTAEGTGVYVDLSNKNSEMDIIIDGTLTGKTQSVLVSENTVADNLTLTVWAITPNKEGNLVEREVEDGKTKADTEIEKKIQYIIKIAENSAQYITTDAKKTADGNYDYALQDETVTLKLNIPAGQRVVNAFNGTNTKVKLLVDANGNYYLKVPRGGGVMLSLELEAIPDPQPSTETKTETAAETTNVIVVTTKVAAMAAAAETSETTAMKALIEDAVKNSGILSVLPDDIKSKLPAGVSKLVEAITFTLENYDSKMGAVTVKIQPTNRKYTKGEKATVAIALPDGKGGYTWFMIVGEGQEDGTLALRLPAATAARLAGKTFVTMILE